MIYFTADTHFGHENIIKMCGRPFETIEAMNEAMIAAWNGRVTGRDTVYIVGDMFFRCKEPEEILKRLKGKKRLIIGNHDSSWVEKVDLSRYFVSVNDLLITTDGSRQLTLCHYPLLSWKHQKTSYMIHGHIHANTEQDFFPLIAKRERMLNAGVDVNGLAPVSFEEMALNNKLFKRRWLDSMGIEACTEEPGEF